MEDHDGNELIDHYYGLGEHYLSHADLPREEVELWGETLTKFGAKTEARREVRRIRRMVRIYQGKNGREVLDV